ncbi:MAG: hypothetical protein JNM85_03095 [Chthonomonas sp.]|nr:hypothetical protein [Chthonomonas sp.]
MNAWSRVSYYRLYWDTQAGIGEIVLTHNLPGEASTETPLTGLSQPTYMAMVDMLRFERPILFNAHTMMLGTENEPTGEEEFD